MVKTPIENLFDNLVKEGSGSCRIAVEKGNGVTGQNTNLQKMYLMPTSLKIFSEIRLFCQFWAQKSVSSQTSSGSSGGAYSSPSGLYAFLHKSMKEEGRWR